MAKRSIFIRHAEAQANSFTGLEGELTVNLTNDTLRVHDGATSGGVETARKDLSNVPSATNAADGKMLASRIVELEAATTKLATIEANAKDDQTGAEIKTLYEAEANTNAYTDAEKAVVALQSGTNTGDEPDGSTTVKGIVELATQVEVDAGTSNVVVATPLSLAGLIARITANDAKVSNATHTGDATGATALTIAANAVTNAKAADMANATIKGRSTAGTGDPEDLTAAQVRTLLNVENGAAADQTATQVPSTATGDVAATNVQAAIAELASEKSNKTAVETLTNKTLTSPVLNTQVTGTAIKDEDDMVSNSAVHLATQQSIKAYSDAYGILQRTSNNTISTISCGVIPFDDTPPLITEGTHILAAAITPKFASSIIAIEVNMAVSATITTMGCIAVFNSTSGALHGVFPVHFDTINKMRTVSCHLEFGAGSGLRTYTVRAGIGSGVMWVNAENGIRRYGGTLKARINLIEYRV